MKGFKVYGLIATLAAMAVCASALAQDGPPQGGQGGPPDMQQGPGGGQGMRGPGRRMGPPPEPLVLRPDVQKELKLSDDQIKKLRSILRPPMGGGPGGGDGQGRGEERRGRGGHGGPPQGDGQGGPPNAGQGGPPQADMGGGGQDPEPDQMGPGGGGPGGGGPQEMDVKLQDVLNDNQMKRLKELQLQRMGAEALTRPGIADKVGLSEEKVAQVRDIVDEARKNMPRPEPGQLPDREKMMKARQAMVAEVNEKVFAILSTKERSQWDRLCGKPFRFDENYRPEPPRYEGNGGGEGR